MQPAHTCIHPRSFAYEIPSGSNTTHSIGIGYLKSYARMGRVVTVRRSELFQWQPRLSPPPQPLPHASSRV